MKVIFLDIDGVLCLDCTNLAPAPLDQLKRIVDATGARIILSSAWRIWDVNREKINTRFRQFGIPELSGWTPNLKGRIQSSERHHEIRQWLDYHRRVTRFAVIDDSQDAELKDAPGSFFLCRMRDGLTAEIADQAIEWLGTAQVASEPVRVPESRIGPGNGVYEVAGAENSRQGDGP